jgi:hypothetical protein
LDVHWAWPRAAQGGRPYLRGWWFMKKHIDMGKTWKMWNPGYLESAGAVEVLLDAISIFVHLDASTDGIAPSGNLKDYN